MVHDDDIPKSYGKMPKMATKPPTSMKFHLVDVLAAKRLDKKLCMSYKKNLKYSLKINGTIRYCSVNFTQSQVFPKDFYDTKD